MKATDELYTRITVSPFTRRLYVGHRVDMLAHHLPAVLHSQLFVRRNWQPAVQAISSGTSRVSVQSPAASSAATLEFQAKNVHVGETFNRLADFGQ